MKSDPDLRKIPLGMLTSSHEERDLVRSHDLDTNAYVVKPVGFQDFVEAIKKDGLFCTIINQAPGSLERSS